MNSINQNQPEHNREDLVGDQAVKRIKSVVDKAKACFFCTTSDGANLVGARPMNVRQVDDDGNLWFLIATDSHAYEQLSRHSDVNLFFQGSPHSDFLHLTGQAAVIPKSTKIDELWEPVLKTWFTEGKTDPRIAVIKVTPNAGYYWDNKHGDTVAGVKILVGALTGQTLDDSIEGSIRLGSNKNL